MSLGSEYVTALVSVPESTTGSEYASALLATPESVIGSEYASALLATPDSVIGSEYVSALLVTPESVIGSEYVSSMLTFQISGVHGVQFVSKTLTHTSFIDGFLSADAAGRSRMIDNFMSVTAKARLLVANGTITAAKLDRVYQQAFSAQWLDSTEFFLDTLLTPPTPLVAGSAINGDDSVSFPDAATTETKVFFRIPEFYDGVGSVTYTLGISPSTSEANSFGVSVEYSVNGGAVVAAGTTNVTPSATADVQSESPPILTLLSSTVSPGDRVMVKIRRLGASDSHAGAMRLYDVRQNTPV